MLHAPRVVIRVSLWFFYYSSSLARIAEGFLQLVVVAEEIAKYSTDVSYSFAGSGSERTIDFEFTPRDRSEMFAVLTEAILPQWGDCNGYFWGLAEEYEAKIQKSPENLRFPEFADDYLVNFVMSFSEFLAADESGTNIGPPEWGCEAYKSLPSGNARTCSLWIDRRTSPRHEGWRRCGGISVSIQRRPQLAPATLSFNPKVPHRIEFQEQDPALQHLTVDLGTSAFVHSDGPTYEIAVSSITEMYKKVAHICPHEEAPGPFGIKELLVCHSSGAVAFVHPGNTVVVWGDPCPATSYQEIVSALIPKNVSIDWSTMTADRFEELCYDYCEQLGYVNVRKVGKTKSRDGGRDLIACKATKKTRFVSEKWIVQCKFTATDASITASKVSGISDVCLEYGAKAYAIMTNGYIDATLYDRLAGIERSQCIDEFETYSKQEMERFLARNPGIRRKYFEV